MTTIPAAWCRSRYEEALNRAYDAIENPDSLPALDGFCESAQRRVVDLGTCAAKIVYGNVCLFDESMLLDDLSASTAEFLHGTGLRFCNVFGAIKDTIKNQPVSCMLMERLEGLNLAQLGNQRIIDLAKPIQDGMTRLTMQELADKIREETDISCDDIAPRNIIDTGREFVVIDPDPRIKL